MHAVSGQAAKRKCKIEDDIEKVNPQDSIGPLPEASCTSPKTLRSSLGVLRDKTNVWCRNKNYRTSDRDNGLLLQSTKDARTNFKLHTLHLEDDFLRSRLNTLIAFIPDF